jgi:hypothetical protein
MFRELMNFSYQRTALQAFGWYLTFLAIGITLGAIAGAILITGATTIAESAQKVLVIGRFVTPLITSGLRLRFYGPDGRPC